MCFFSMEPNPVKFHRPPSRTFGCIPDNLARCQGLFMWNRFSNWGYKIELNSIKTRSREKQNVIILALFFLENKLELICPLPLKSCLETFISMFLFSDILFSKRFMHWHLSKGLMTRISREGRGKRMLTALIYIYIFLTTIVLWWWR